MEFKYCYCTFCKALLDESILICPKCNNKTIPPIQSDDPCIAELIEKGSPSRYKQYVWDQENAVENLEHLRITYLNRDLRYENGMIRFEKESSRFIGAIKFRLAVKMPQNEHQKLQRLVDSIPFDQWITPIPMFVREIDFGGGHDIFCCTFKNGTKFKYILDNDLPPGYLNLYHFMWNIVKSSQYYTREMDWDPANDNECTSSAIRSKADKQKWDHLSDTRDIIVSIAERDIRLLKDIGNGMQRLQEKMKYDAQQIEDKLKHAEVIHNIVECVPSISEEKYRIILENYEREIQVAQEKMESIESAYEALSKSISAYGDYIKLRNIPENYPPIIEPEFYAL